MKARGSSGGGGLWTLSVERWRLNVEPSAAAFAISVRAPISRSPAAGLTSNVQLPKERRGIGESQIPLFAVAHEDDAFRT